MNECRTVVVINVSGGVVQDVFAGLGSESLEAIVVDWDTESCTPDEKGIVAITNDRGEQQLADVIRHDCIPLATLEGTDVGNALRAAAGDKPLASLLQLNASPAAPPSGETSRTLEPVPSPAALLEFAEEVARLLYADQDTGRLTGENTLAARSGADFIDALQLLLSRHGITPRLEDA